MSFKVVIESQAREDILRNARWWAQEHSLDEALVWFDAIYKQLETLSEFPERHPLAPESELFDFELRQKPVGLGTQKGYRALYRTIDATVYVLTIQRGSQDEIYPADLS